MRLAPSDLHNVTFTSILPTLLPPCLPLLSPSPAHPHHLFLFFYRYAIAAEGGPGPRIGHSCASVGGSAYVFGGATPDGPLDELHAFDQARLVWTAQGQGSGASPPQPRYEHLTFSVPAKGQFCVFAGAHAAGNFNDLHVYNVATASWEQPVVTGTAPSARTNPKGASEKENPLDIHVYIYIAPYLILTRAQSLSSLQLG